MTKVLDKTNVSKLRNALMKIDKEKLSENGLFASEDYSLVLLNQVLLELLKNNGYSEVSLDLIKYSYKTKKIYIVLQEKTEKKKKDFEIRF